MLNIFCKSGNYMICKFLHFIQIKTYHTSIKYVIYEHTFNTCIKRKNFPSLPNNKYYK